ncbi:MAG: hypothetical protein PHU25_09905 [Deltaproteobacteria bacterium]|nr:hypothetical protein [Deltaproteobacteria bacterium]
MNIREGAAFQVGDEVTCMARKKSRPSLMRVVPGQEPADPLPEEASLDDEWRAEADASFLGLDEITLRLAVWNRVPCENRVA